MSRWFSFPLKSQMIACDVTIEHLARICAVTRRTVVAWRGRKAVPWRLRVRVADFFATARRLARDRYRHYLSHPSSGLHYVRAGVGPVAVRLPMRPARGGLLRFTLRRADAQRLHLAGVRAGTWWGQWLGDEVEWLLVQVRGFTTLAGRVLALPPWRCPSPSMWA